MIDFWEHLPKDFFLRPTEWVAKNLIGKLLVRRIDGEYVAAKIVETEAYLAENDFASHSASGQTQRNRAMFAEGGCIYVYKIYGIHNCVNIVTERENRGCAVLLRSGEPIAGFELMKKFRGNIPVEKFLFGPGNFARGFNFELSDNFKNLFTEELFIQKYEDVDDSHIGISKRIGIIKSKELELRFYLKGSKFVSGSPKD